VYVTNRIKAFEVGPDKHLVCNAISGEILVMSAAGLRLLDSLRKGDVSSCNPSLLDKLERAGFLFASRVEEEAAFVGICRSSWDDFQLSVPQHYTFILNTHCNFNCPYCFEQEAFRAHASTLSREQIDAAFQVVDRHAAEWKQGPEPDFEIFGGEPLLPGSRPMLEHLVSRISERGYEASIQTNGFFCPITLIFLSGTRSTSARFN